MDLIESLRRLSAIKGRPFTVGERAEAAIAMSEAADALEAMRDAKEKMLAQVKWEACDCGCERDKPADAASVAWLRASALLRDQKV